MQAPSVSRSVGKRRERITPIVERCDIILRRSRPPSTFGSALLQYTGHAAQVLALTAQHPAASYYTKWIIAVDEDVDPTNQVKR